MTRNIEISRDEAELLTDLLMLTNSHLAAGLTDHIRELFGMVPEQDELSAMGMTKQEFLDKWQP